MKVGLHLNRAVLLAVVFAAGPVAAEMRPMVFDAKYVEPKAPSPPNGTAAPVPAAVPISCKLGIADLTDERVPADFMGSFFDQPFHPPQDRKAWLRSMAEGLKTRGVDVAFRTDSAPLPAGYAPVTLALKTGWVDYNNGGFSATVVFRLTSKDSARPFEKNYRGSFWRTLFMASVGGRSTDAVNGAVAIALDKIAADMKLFC
jgi:hypothetical protein